MTIKEAILQSLEDRKNISTYMDIYKHLVGKGYYEFKEAKTPASTVSALLGDFIRNGDTRVKRIKGKGGTFSYYLTKYEKELGVEIINETEKVDTKIKGKKSYYERDLHKLLSSYLKSKGTYSKTIFHESSRNSKDSHQKWVHPDMIGINFQKFQNKASQTLLRAINKEDTFKITSYELKKEINNDYELKKSFFQTVSNSSWANYGYLVAFEISKNLDEEIERLSQSFGIGVIELKSNPYESKILYPSKLRELDYKTIDKLCLINPNFEKFIEQVEKLLTANERYVKATEKELDELCDDYFNNDSEIKKYCIDKRIPIEEDINENKI